MEISKVAYGKVDQSVGMRIVIFTYNKGEERKEFETSVVSAVWKSTKSYFSRGALFTHFFIHLLI